MENAGSSKKMKMSEDLRTKKVEELTADIASLVEDTENKTVAKTESER